MEPFKPAIDEMLRDDLDAPKRQRHTARRVFARLVDEHGAVGLSYSGRESDWFYLKREQLR